MVGVRVVCFRVLCSTECLLTIILVINDYVHSPIGSVYIARMLIELIEV